MTVPTPVLNNKRPDLIMLRDASKMIGKFLKIGDIVIFEPTVYPGCTEEECVPVLERYSKLEFNKDFSCGYSLERISPSSTSDSLTNISKITSGSTEDARKFVDDLYKEIISAETFSAAGIKIAEAAKVVENSQRDVNIAFMDEISQIFNRLNLNTGEVLEAANTKWNFLPFEPGLVGGHCIGVDPYYLIHKAEEVGIAPALLKASSHVNESIGKYVAEKLLKDLRNKGKSNLRHEVLILGLTFNENCSDLRNSRVFDIISCLQENGVKTDVYEPCTSRDEKNKIPLINFVEKIKKKYYDAVVMAVAHDVFKSFFIEDLNSFCKQKNIIYDLKSKYPKEMVSFQL